MSAKRSDCHRVSNDQDCEQPPASLSSEEESCRQLTSEKEMDEATEDETVAIDNLAEHEINDPGLNTRYIPRTALELAPPKPFKDRDWMSLAGSKESNTSTNTNTNTMSKLHGQSEAVVSIASDRFARYPDPEKDISRVLKSYQRLHDRFAQIRQRLEFLPRRYLVVVVPEGRSAFRANVDKHLILLKGNRLTTIETIRRMYSISTASEDFGFLLGRMAVNDTDRMEELDFFQSKVVVLRCVSQQDVTLFARDVIDGLLLQPKKPLVSSEMIEID